MSKQIAPTSVPARCEDVLATESQGTAVLMSMDTGKFVELNETAREVWELTDGARSVAQVVATMVERFDVGQETCEAQVLALYSQMHDEGLVALAA